MSLFSNLRWLISVFGATLLRFLPMIRLSTRLVSTCILLSGPGLAAVQSYGYAEDDYSSPDEAITLTIRNNGWYFLNYMFDRYICMHSEIGIGSVIDDFLLIGQSASFPVYSTSQAGLPCRVLVCPTPCLASNTRYYTITKPTIIRCAGNLFTFRCNADAIE